MKKTIFIKLFLLSCGLALCTQPVNSNAQESETVGMQDENIVIEQREATSYINNMDRNNLNGYELPIFSEYEYNYQGAIVAESLKYLGKTPFVAENNESFLENPLFIETILMDIFQLQPEEILTERFLFTEEAELQYGDVLSWNGSDEEIYGLYIGQGKIIFWIII